MSDGTKIIDGVPVPYVETVVRCRTRRDCPAYDKPYTVQLYYGAVHIVCHWCVQDAAAKGEPQPRLSVADTDALTRHGALPEPEVWKQARIRAEKLAQLLGETP